MRLHDNVLSISPTDLSQFLSCRHRNALELSVAHGARELPRWDNPLLETLAELGRRHERDYVLALKQQGKTVADLHGVIDRDDAVDKTLKAMQAGVDIIVQAALSHRPWYGRPDVLMKVDVGSDLGSWSYEPADAKLARETRGGTILQLGLYCELLHEAQGTAPIYFHVISPTIQGEGQVQRTYRLQEYAAYFRLIKANLEKSIPLGYRELERLNEPEPVDHCLICPWFGTCQDKWREDDHLCLVAGISRLQRRELPLCGIHTVAALAAAKSPFTFKPKRGNTAAYERVRDQALVQIRSRAEGRIVYELIPQPVVVVEDGQSQDPVGLARLPEPSLGDVFLDLEGDSLASNGGREYLFGLVTVEPQGERYQSWWATNPAEERAAFEAVVDLLIARLAIYPDLHIYHYAPYEPTAFKRLMGRYASREDAIDRLLRGKRFIDLYAVVCQSMRVGVERYSIKNLEPLYDFHREVDLKGVSRALKSLEQYLELGRLELITPALKDRVEGYNRDDCVSTRRLRDWLEQKRAEVIASGQIIDRPFLQSGDPPGSVDDTSQRVEELRHRLLLDVPDDPAKRTPNQQAMYQLAYLLDWHRREEKSTWWEFFRMLELPEEELLEEAKAVAQLELLGRTGLEKSRTLRFRYPPQEFEVRAGETLYSQVRTKFGEVKECDRHNRTIDLIVPKKQLTDRPTALFVHSHVSTKAMQEALLALGDRVIDAGSIEALSPCPERALLLREPPTLLSCLFQPPSFSGSFTVTDYATQIVTQLDRTALAIQGPPGSGKTYTGAKMIITAVQAGLKVGVTATSHKVIQNLLKAVAKQANQDGISIRLGHIERGNANKSSGPIKRFTDNRKALAELHSGAIQVLGATAWPWSSEDAKQTVDVLFVDEAGQVSLANVLAVAGAAGTMVLLGDPQQLEQPSKGSHPPGVGLSALQYILGEDETMPRDKGLFLPVTWRLSPSICQFTSELFYASELSSSPGTEHQTLIGSPFDGRGLWLVEVAHDGNSSVSSEEAAELVRIVSTLLQPGVRWVDHRGREHPMTSSDLRIVAPFNAHVSRIAEAFLKAGHTSIPVGTVDKFQGQEAPVAIYAMATSRPEDAPRGMEFLYSLNRLNVATSRARCAAIILASPHLFNPDCQTPQQMKLANALCRFREMATLASNCIEI